MNAPSPGWHPDSKLLLVQGDITKAQVDAIVNAANTSLLGGGGVDGAIHRAAGPELLAACRQLHGCHTGQAKLTLGYRLAAKYVIHTVGPIYAPDNIQQARFLAACYENSLDLARQYQCHTIAFPAISTGVYGYPHELAAQIALQTLCDWLSRENTWGMQVSLYCFNEQTLQAYQACQTLPVIRENQAH